MDGDLKLIIVLIIITMRLRDSQTNMTGVSRFLYEVYNLKSTIIFVSMITQKKTGEWLDMTSV